MTHLQKVAIMLSLRATFNQSYFEISGIANACKIVGLPIYTDTMEWKVLQAMHCKQWKDIDTEARSELVALVMSVLGIDSIHEHKTLVSHIPAEN